MIDPEEVSRYAELLDQELPYSVPESKVAQAIADEFTQWLRDYQSAQNMSGRLAYAVTEDIIRAIAVILERHGARK